MREGRVGSVRHARLNKLAADGGATAVQSAPLPHRVEPTSPTSPAEADYGSWAALTPPATVPHASRSPASLHAYAQKVEALRDYAARHQGEVILFTGARRAALAAHRLRAPRRRRAAKELSGARRGARRP